jgi:hypothetical protein
MVAGAPVGVGSGSGSPHPASSASVTPVVNRIWYMCLFIGHSLIICLSSVGAMVETQHSVAENRRYVKQLLPGGCGRKFSAGMPGSQAPDRACALRPEIEFRASPWKTFPHTWQHIEIAACFACCTPFYSCSRGLRTRTCNI